jgi:hypothetical protein
VAAEGPHPREARPDNRLRDIRPASSDVDPHIAPLTRATDRTLFDGGSSLMIEADLHRGGE